jgi:hypothetical protein
VGTGRNQKKEKERTKVTEKEKLIDWEATD